MNTKKNKQRQSYLSIFLYGKLSTKPNLIANGLGLTGALNWLYFTLIHKGFFSLFYSGKLTLIDILVGFPLIIALAPVIYALIYWLIKWIIIFFFPEHASVEPIDHSDD